MKVLITGISSDIGVSIANLFLANGWVVLGQYRNMNPALKNLKDSFPKDLTLLKFDLLTDQLSKKLGRYSDELGSCDSFISCAAELVQSNFSEVSDENLMRTFRINTFPYYLIIKELLPNLERRGWGRILNISSIGVKFGGGKNSFLYSLSKHSAEFIPAEAKNWAKQDIFLNVLRVGVTDTKIHLNLPQKNLNERVQLIPAGRMAHVTEISKMAYLLASRENTYISGQTIAISGGE